MPQELKPSGAVLGISVLGAIAAPAATESSGSAPRFRCGNSGKAIRSMVISPPRNGTRSAYKDTECRNGDLYRGECTRSARRRSSNGFSSDYEGTAFAAPGPKSVIVWCYRDEQTAVSQEKWMHSMLPLQSGSAPQPVKLVKDHGRHTTVCYFVRPNFLINNLILYDYENKETH